MGFDRRSCMSTHTKAAVRSGPRVLFYGGCHAQILQRIFREHGSVPGARYDCVVNFRLIESGQPFPLQQALACDAVVLSPILNRPGYLTADLVPVLRAGGVRVLSFPWLQWQGYFPLVRKAPFMGQSAWHHALLPPEVWEAPPQAMVNRVMEQLADPDLPQEHLARTTQVLRRNEELGECEIRVADHILAHHRQQRLFMTPDHPAKALYEVVAGAVSEALGPRRWVCRCTRIGGPVRWSLRAITARRFPPRWRRRWACHSTTATSPASSRFSVGALCTSPSTGTW